MMLQKTMPYSIPGQKPSRAPCATRRERVLLFSLCLVCAFCLLLSGCGGKPAKTALPAPELFTPLEYSGAITLAEAEAQRLVTRLSAHSQGLGSWTDIAFAVRQSLAYASTRPANQTAFSFAGANATWGDIARGQALLYTLLPQLDANPSLLATAFTWVRLGPDFSFTGYYEPTLLASREPTRELPHPLYRRPPELRNGIAYHTRNAIDRNGALRGRGLEFAWVDETDAYFLQVQGSGRLQFPDGDVIHALYDGKNNQAYASLGRIMKERGLLPEDGVSMQAIRKYLAEHPEERAELFDQNASYVFFRPEVYGPLGSMGKVLTPWVSLAVDRRVVPLGSLTMVIAPLPGPEGNHTIPFPALTLPQDTGGAIKGHRIDLFCGSGAKATHVAGHLNARGAVYILLPK